MKTNWADADDDSEDDVGVGAAAGGKSGTRFETAPDKDGVKTVIEYLEKGGQTYKVTKRVKVTIIAKRTNAAIMERKSMRKFGKAVTNGEKNEAMLVVRMEEEVPIELSKKAFVTLAAKDDVEDKFLEDSINITEGLFKEKTAWSSSAARTSEREIAEEAVKPVDLSATPAGGKGAAGAADANAAGRYVPPSLRGKDGKGDGKGGPPDQEASLRITNLSEDVREGDLQDLFAQCGRLQRVYIAKDFTTGISRGFAFVTYYNREDAQKAINRLHGHGYDNLILQVQFAKPKT